MHTARAALCTWTLVMNRMRVFAFAGSDELGKGISEMKALQKQEPPSALVRYR